MNKGKNNIFMKWKSKNSHGCFIYMERSDYLVLLLGIIIGMFIGATAGAVVMALCSVAKRADEAVAAHYEQHNKWSL